MNEAERMVELIPRLRRYARALTGERSAADDLVQDTLERALSRFHLWRQGSDLRAWLFTIMHNVYVNQTRSRIRHPSIPCRLRRTRRTTSAWRPSPRADWRRWRRTPPASLR